MGAASSACKLRVARTGAGAPAAGGAGPEEMDLTFGEGLMAQLEALGAEGLGDLKPPDL